METEELFATKWEKALMKLSKKRLIDLYRTAAKNALVLEETLKKRPVLPESYILLTRTEQKIENISHFEAMGMLRFTEKYLWLTSSPC